MGVEETVVVALVDNLVALIDSLVSAGHAKHKDLSLAPRIHLQKMGLMVPAGNPNTGKVKTGAHQPASSQSRKPRSK